MPRALGLPTASTLAGDVAFAQGVASGEPTPGGITLWTRLDGLEAPADLIVEVARDPGFGSVVMAAPVPVSPEAGGSAHVRLDDARLTPGEQYWYRFAARDVDSPVGRFRTARPPDSREPVRIAFFSCQDWMAGFYTAHGDLAARDDIDLAVCLGDYVYERAYITSTDKNPPVRADDTAEGGETQTFEEYRRKYALYHSDPNLQAVRARHPIAAIWDDHEVEDNYSDGQPGEATRNRRIPFLERRANSYRAFFEHMPRSRRPEEADRIYGSMHLGAAELFFLDTRQYRDQQPCGGSNLLDLCLSPEVGRPGRTLLGPAQLAWLKDGLARSTAPWKVVANQVMVMSLDLLPRIPLNVDSWDGYTAERAELIDHIAAAGVRDVTFITGDIHTFFAGNVTRTGHQISRDGSLSVIDGPPRATEFVGGAISSPGLVDRWAGPSERERVFQAHGLDRLVMVMNQHLTYVNQAYKGYGVMEAAESGLRVEFRAVRDARVPDGPCFTLRTFSVARGDARVVDEGGPRIPYS